MGVIGEMVLGGLGSLAGGALGERFGNRARGEGVGKTIGTALGTLVPFQKGGRVMPKKNYKKKKNKK